MILHFTDHTFQAVQCTAQAMALLPKSELGVLHASCCKPVGLVTATEQNAVQWSPTSFAEIHRIPYRLLDCKRVPCASTVNGLIQRTSINKNSSEKYSMSRPALRYIQPCNRTVLEIQRPGREADDWTPTSAEDMSKWSSASKPLIRPHGMHSDFTFS
jgi:hypothetical protein